MLLKHLPGLPRACSYASGSAQPCNIVAVSAPTLTEFRAFLSKVLNTFMSPCLLKSLREAKKVGSARTQTEHFRFPTGILL